VKILKINNKSIEIRLVSGLNGYYIYKLADWNKEVAVALAKQDDLILDEIHWCVINEYRKYDKVLKDKIVANCQITFEIFMKLFPKGRHQAARISGVSLPTGFGNEHWL